ncbi:hypothetical protein [Chitinasiproducens palmae]|uniref:Uncharacterized protein n=1 Tax=Chitinasiproducens palmae TaxID=1770053 RepID=A0A1H2PVL2_9BURK|nr:hypothetical protein [Chitinasiproducens palmae]SDV51326.1 hypothetical protein SAMN05216551_11672 [Chitinasiproducens palmae]
MSGAQEGLHSSDGKPLSPASLLAAMVPAFDLAPHRDVTLRHRRRVARNALAAGLALGLLAGLLADSPPVRRLRIGDRSSPSTAPSEPATPHAPPSFRTGSGGPTDAEAIDEAARLAAQIDAIEARRREQALQVARAQRLPALLDALAELAESARAPSLVTPRSAAASPGNDARPVSAKAPRAARHAPHVRVVITALRWRDAIIEIECAATTASRPIDMRGGRAMQVDAQRGPVGSHGAGSVAGVGPARRSGRQASLAAVVDDWLTALRHALPEAVVTVSGLRLLPRPAIDEMVFTVHVGDGQAEEAWTTEAGDD